MRLHPRAGASPECWVANRSSDVGKVEANGSPDGGEPGQHMGFASRFSGCAPSIKSVDCPEAEGSSILGQCIRGRAKPCTLSKV